MKFGSSRQWLGALFALPIASAVILPSRAESTAVHLRLVKAEPAQDSVVPAPKHLRLWFSLKPNVALTSVKLADAANVAVKLGKPTFAGVVKQPVEVSVDETLRPGRYTVRWQTASADMHAMKGEYSFTVK